MALMRIKPFRQLDRLADPAMAGARAACNLPMAAFRRGDRFVVAFDVPGVRGDDIDITTESNVIEITGIRRPMRRDGDEVIIDERPQGDFRRQLFLGENLDTNKMTAECHQGVLTLTIPVSEQSKPRKVRIANPAEEQQNTGSDVRSLRAVEA